MSAENATSAAPLVQVKHLYKEFGMGSQVISVLRDVNLTIRRQEMVAIVGASGAGKSTFLHCLGTLDQPTRGEIRFLGEDITRSPPAELAHFRNHQIGFVFQFHHLLPEFTALENVMMPALISRMPAKEAKERACELLEAVDVSDRLKHRPGELSGGQKQRVAIARALVMQPKLLLADEPTGNLDTKTSQAVHDLLIRLNEERDLSMLIATHNLELAGTMPRTVRMADGQVLDAGELPSNSRASAEAQLGVQGD